MRWKIQLSLLLTPLLLSMAACNSSQSTLNPGGPAARNIATLTWIVVITFAGIALIMWVLLLWVALRRRGSLDTHEPPTAGGGQAWVLIGGFAIPFLVLSAMFGMSLDWMGRFPIHAGDPPVPQIHIIGHQWWWEVKYDSRPPDQQFTTANEIHIPVGKPIDILLTSADVIHSFWVPTLHGKQDIIPGQPNVIRIQADAPGNYEGECAVFCGEQHARMRLLVVAQPEEEYEAWYQHQLQPAVQPTDAEALHGEDVFMGAPCALCHSVRGTMAGGRVAPDLTHLASRQEIAGNSYTNDKAYLEAWVTHAQSLKPGAEMPDLTAFSGTDLRALVAYLRQLK